MDGTTLWYATLGGNVLSTLTDEFAITTALCDISYFDYAIANTPDNRTIINANLTQDFIVKRWSDDKTIFTGRIADKSYKDRTNMFLSGHSAFVTLTNKKVKCIPAGDLVDPAFVTTYTNMGGYVDKTTAATNSTINDVPIAFNEAYASLHIGSPTPFNAVKIKYSTKGVCSAHDLQYAYMRDMGDHGATKPLQGVLDLSHGFTEDAGTFYIMFDSPDRWRKALFGMGNYEYYIFLRIHPVNSTPYTTPPILDQIWIGKPTKPEADDRPITPLRIEFVDTAANSILADVLTGTGYTIGSCPSTPISPRGEYLNPLQWVAMIAGRLKVVSGGETTPYEWYIDDTLKKVHILPYIGVSIPVPDVSETFSLLEHITHHGQQATRVICLGAFNGTQQPSAYAEDYSVPESEIREIVVSDIQVANREALDDKAQKILTELKEPPKELPVSLRTDIFVDNYYLGDSLPIYQPQWGLESGVKYRIIRAVMGPIYTKLTLGIRGQHMEDVRSKLQSEVDVLSIWHAVQQSNDGGYF